jgi:hypothetical protein
MLVALHEWRGKSSWSVREEGEGGRVSASVSGFPTNPTIRLGPLFSLLHPPGLWFDRVRKVPMSCIYFVATFVAA